LLFGFCTGDGSIEHREYLIIFIVGPWNVRLFFQNKMDLRALEKFWIIGRGQLSEAKAVSNK